MAKIYTKAGDQGDTGLASGTRLPKDDRSVEAYGTVDELNALLGIVRSEALPDALQTALERIQHELFEVGSDLSAPWTNAASTSKNSIVRVSPSMVARLEKEIDRIEQELSPLRSFILPGGSRVASCLHFARTVCRRAERCAVTLLKQDACNPEIVRYLNRLSDWLFVAARYSNFHDEIGDIPWNPPASRDKAEP